MNQCLGKESEIDPVDNDGANGSSGLQAVIERIHALDESRDIEGLCHVLKDAVKELGMSEVALLEEFLGEHTGFGPRTITTMVKEARNYVPDFGYVHTVDDVVKAYSDALTREYRAVVSCGSSLYYYDDDTGFFEVATIDKLEKHVLDTFAGLPVLQKAGTVQQVIKRIRMRFHDEEFFVVTKAGMNFSNGFLAIDHDGQPKLLPHSPDHKALMRIDAAYDADASFEWLEDALRVNLPHRLLRDALQEIAAAILFGIKPPKDGVRRMFIMHGARRSGKSTLIGMLEKLLPPSVISSIPPGHWGEPIFRAALENVVLNCVTELGGNTRIGGEHMKKIVSCERVIARRMRRDPVSFVPRAWHLFATNELPKIMDSTDAFERRILVVTFPVSLSDTQVDSSFDHRIGANPSAIVAWALKGAERLHANGKFTLPDGHLEAAAEMRFGRGSPMAFAHAEIERAPGKRITSADLRNAMRAFSISRDIDPDTMHDGAIRTVAGFMQTHLGAERRKTNGAPFYQGVALRSSPLSGDSDTDEVPLDDL